MGSLSKLQSLDLAYNQLQGRLPQTLADLSALSTFYYDTGRLCAPPNAAFQAWLARIPDKVPGISNCGSCFLPLLTR